MKRRLIVLGVLCAASTVLRADEGRIPVYQQTMITESGSYILTRDISVSSGVVIEIKPPASHVTLDLGGHTIQSGSSSQPAILVLSVPFVTIRNGLIQGGSPAIQQGVSSRRLRVENVEIADAKDAGVRANPLGSVEIAGCHIHDIDGTGLYLLDTENLMEPTYGARIVDNVIERVTGNGIFLTGVRSAEIRRNRISDWGTTGSFSGITLQPVDPDTTCGGSIIADNVLGTIYATSGTGLFLGCSRNLVTGNVVRGATARGIWVISDENRIERNISSGNTGHGIEVGVSGFPTFATRNHLEANQVEGNLGAASCGISFANGNGHTFRNNVARGNPTAICGGSLGTNTDAGGNLP